MTLFDAIHGAAEQLSRSGIATARLDAELLLRHILGRDRAWLLAHVHDALDAEQQKVFEHLVGRRRYREPIQYIIGIQEFWGLEFITTADVLIPRPETELVVEFALTEAREMKAPVIVDLCTGSGCIAISLARELPTAIFLATDISEKALAIARDNAHRNGVSDRIRFLEGDLLWPLDELNIRGRVDMIVSNPPYVRSSELEALQPEVREFEPTTALIAGPEGTEIHERIIGAAHNHLKRNGALIMEMGHGQTAKLAALMRESDQYDIPVVLNDLAGIERVIAARRK